MNVQFRPFVGRDQCWGAQEIRNRLSVIAGTKGRWFQRDLIPAHPGRFHSCMWNRFHNIGVIRRSCLSVDNYAARDLLQHLYDVVWYDKDLLSLFQQAIQNFHLRTGLQVAIPTIVESSPVVVTTEIPIPTTGDAEPTTVIYETGPTVLPVHHTTVVIDSGPTVLPMPFYCPPPPVIHMPYRPAPCPATMAGRVLPGTGHTGFSRFFSRFTAPSHLPNTVGGRVLPGTGRTGFSRVTAPVLRHPPLRTNPGTRVFHAAPPVPRVQTAFTRATHGFHGVGAPRMPVGTARGFR